MFGHIDSAGDNLLFPIHQNHEIVCLVYAEINHNHVDAVFCNNGQCDHI